jgi:hypothetical protein
VLINGERGMWAWKFTFDPFSSNGANYKRSLFGDKGGVPFLFKGRGVGDSLAVLKSRGRRGAKIEYRGLNNKKVVRTIRVRDVVTNNVAPMLLRNGSGRDDFVFVEAGSQGTVAFRVNSRGRVLSTTNYPPGVTVVAGYFSGREYEELAYLWSKQLVIGEGSAEPFLLSGELVMGGSKEYDGGAISPTPLPVVTVVNISSPAPIVTGVVTAAATSTAYPTYTSYPTFTPPMTSTPPAQRPIRQLAPQQRLQRAR